VRLDRQLRELFRDFYRAGSVIFHTAAERDAALQAMLALGRRYGTISAVVVGVAVLVGIFDHFGLFSGTSINWRAAGIVDAGDAVVISLPLLAILVLVCVPAGSIAGYIIGKIIAFQSCKKSKTTIGDNAFVGSHATLVAPVTIARDSYIAAGSVITKPVPEGALALGRSRQELKEGWVARRRKKT